MIGVQSKVGRQGFIKGAQVPHENGFFPPGLTGKNIVNKLLSSEKTLSGCTEQKRWASSRLEKDAREVQRWNCLDNVGEKRAPQV